MDEIISMLNQPRFGAIRFIVEHHHLSDEHYHQLFNTVLHLLTFKTPTFIVKKT